jgi:hypothetical protein
MTPLQDIRFADPMTPEQRNAALYEGRQSRLFQAVIEYLRAEGFAALAESVELKRASRHPESDLALGGFDRISQAVVKLKTQSEIAPPVSE